VLTPLHHDPELLTVADAVAATVRIAQGRSDEDRVVEVAEDGNEVGTAPERKRNVRDL